MRLLICALLLASTAGAEALTPIWVELGPEGAVLARVIVRRPGSCPELTTGSGPLPMTQRRPVPAGFEPVCEAVLPSGVKQVRLGAQKLALPKTPKTVVVVGDTGCRVAGSRIQDCADPAKWPLQQVARSIAKTKPDLIVHVGDYLYRETACADPSKGCEGPHGDNWPAWNADFFGPAAAALASAPWAFSRGNHEDCARAWRGWFYYLDPRPYPAAAACQLYSEPYLAISGDWKLGMLDSSATKEDEQDPPQIERYGAQLSTFSGKANWIAAHHPFWAYKRDFTSRRQLVISQPLAAAWDAAKPTGIDFVLSGHVHLFEFLAFAGKRPNQLVAGDGGTDLAESVATDFAGQTVSGAAVQQGRSRHEFGYTVLQRDRTTWRLTLHSAAGKKLIRCRVPPGGGAVCGAT